MPNELIDRLFARFATLYGNRFVDLWRNIDMVEVRAAWAHELQPYSPQIIGTAVKGLGTHPPSLPEFIDLCQRAKGTFHASFEPALPAPKEDPTTPEVSAARERCMETMRKYKNPQPSHNWAYKLAARRAAGEKLLPCQLLALATFTDNTGIKFTIPSGDVNL